MANFNCACGNQALEYKSGTSSKTGKKWQGWKCEPCNVMYGMDGRPWGDKPKSSPAGFKPQGNGTQITSLEVKVDKILAILQANFEETAKEPF